MKNKILGILVVLMMVFTVTTTVKAVTIDDLMAQVKLLQKQVSDLKLQVKAEVLDVVSDMVAPVKTDTRSTTSVSATTNTSANTAPAFTVPIAIGAKGDGIKTLQNALIEKGLLAPDNNTGYFGPLTKQALATYQATNNINATGKLNTQTIATINKSASTENNIAPLRGTPNPEPSQILFSEVNNTGFPDFNSIGSVAWGDYNTDGYLDVLICGMSNESPSVPTTRIYHNNGNGTFTDINAGLAGTDTGSVAWGDYDNDGYLDILITNSGSIGHYGFVKIYHNELGPNNTRIFVEKSSKLTYVQGEFYKAIWGDSNNDGYLDVLVSGIFNGSSAQGSVKLYINDGSGDFSNATTVFEGSIVKSMAFGDYNNDGRLDILLSFINDPSTNVYRNNGNNSFTKVAEFPNKTGDVAWGDYNNDGNLDILIEGIYDVPPDMAKVYKNNGDGTFTLTNIAINGTSGDNGYGSVAWGDYNNDGKLDILIAGYSCTGHGCFPITSVYTNNGGDSFVSIDGAIENNLHTMEGIISGHAIWSDYNNDGYLDVLLAGVGTAGPIVKLYRNTFGNNSNVVNTPPSKPTNLHATVNNNRVTLSWDKATDNQTPQSGLSYNIYLGTTPLGINKVSPMAKVPDGLRRIATIGGQNENTSWTVKNLALGTYYWGVQAIDTAFAGSNFAVAQNSFAISVNPSPISSTEY